jgi:lipid-A-disaccharide synthase
MMECIDAGGDALVVVDAPDLHLPLARRARALGIPAIGYVSPQIWAWRPGRARHIAAELDALLCLFKFEPPLYSKALTGETLDVRWVGHPLVDRMPTRNQATPDLFGLLPGSRDQELARLLGPFIQTAAALRRAHPSARFRLVGDPVRLHAFASIPDWVELVPDITSLRSARGALTKSGTVTLELALMGVPMVVAHRVHPLTYWLGRFLVRGIKHIALPNILAGTEVVPEHIQRIRPEQLARELSALPLRQDLFLEALGPPGASHRAAAAVQDLWA